MKIAIYLRCSTNEDQQDVDSQVEKCINYCKANEWEYEIIKEYASAWNKPRPEFHKLLERIRLREFQILLCFDLDRFSRDDPHIADGHLNRIVHEYSCRFISLNDNIDSQNEITWHIVRHVMVWQANKYSQRLSDRIKEGIKNKQRKLRDKYSHGRKRKCNYEQIKSLYEEGKSISAIAKELGINKGSVFNAVKNQVIINPIES